MINILEYERFRSQKKGWSNAFKKAILDLVASGGGMLYVPAGSYETCSIQLYSNIQLFLETGAELRYINDSMQYQMVELGYEGKVSFRCMPLVYAKDARNIVISGHGLLDGQGAYWWYDEALKEKRPYMIHFENCTDVKIRDIRLVNSPAWTVHPHYCDNVEISGISIKNPKDSPNTDGINPECCRNVRISSCNIDVGDDCISLKAGTEETANVSPCENVIITNCNMIHGHGGVVVGSEMSGAVRNVIVSNCVFQDTDRGIRVKTRRGRGGAVEHILINNVIMDNVFCPFIFNMFYMCGATTADYKEKIRHPVTKWTPRIRDIQIQNVIADRVVAAAAFFYGLPEMPVEDITLSDCRITMTDQRGAEYPAMMEDIAPMQSAGAYLRYTRGVTFRNFNVLQAEGEEILIDDTVEQFSRF